MIFVATTIASRNRGVPACPGPDLGPESRICRVKAACPDPRSLTADPGIYPLINCTSRLMWTVFTHQDAARLQGRIPVQAEVLAIDLSSRGKADARVPPRVFAGGAGAIHSEGHRLGDAVQGEVAGDAVFGIALALDLGGLKRHGGVFLRFEEVGALQVAVPLRIRCVQTGDVDAGLDARAGGVRGVFQQRSAEAGKGSLHVGDHHVLHLELGCRVGGVEFPGDDGGGGGGGCSHGWLLSQLWMREEDIRCNKYLPAGWVYWSMTAGSCTKAGCPRSRF